MLLTGLAVAAAPRSSVIVPVDKPITRARFTAVT